MTFHDREPPPSTMRSRSMTRASTQIGSSGGSPKTVTPPISIPVISRVDSAGANDALRVPSRSRTARLTSRRFGSEHDAGRVARRVALADHQDRVGRVLGREPVRGAERGRVGQGGIAGEELVFDPERLERRDEASPTGRVVRRVEDRGRVLTSEAYDAGPPATIDRHGRPSDDPAPDRAARHRRLPRALRLAPGAGIDRLPRRGGVARGDGAARRDHVGRRARVPLRHGDGPGDGRTVAVRRISATVLRPRRRRARVRPQSTLRPPPTSSRSSPTGSPAA